MYFLAVGHYKLGNWSEAKRYNCAFLERGGGGGDLVRMLIGGERFAALLLEKEPTNRQAQSLAGLIDSAVAKGAVFPSFTRSKTLCLLLALVSLFSWYRGLWYAPRSLPPRCP